MERSLFVAEHLTRIERTGNYPEGALGIHGSLMAYSYPKNKPGDPYPEKNGQSDHAMDALRYFVINKHGVVAPPKIENLNPRPMSTVIGDHAWADPMDYPDNW